MLAHRLWNHLGELPVHKFRIRCVELLHELHHALDDSCDAVEDAIGLALMNESMEKKIDAFNRFVTLWHLGRDIETNPRLRGCLRGFDKYVYYVLLTLYTSQYLIYDLINKRVYARRCKIL
jgi:hypothetical protein